MTLLLIHENNTERFKVDERNTIKNINPIFHDVKSEDSHFIYQMQAGFNLDFDVFVFSKLNESPLKVVFLSIDPYLYVH